MPQKTRAELKVYYKQGSNASQSQYDDLIDSLLNIVDDSTGIVQPTLLGKTLFVDANASGTGVHGNVYQPYQSPNLALADAMSGDTIIIMPGEYTCNNLYKPGISFFAFPGVEIIHNDGFFALFDDSAQSPGSFSFRGTAKFIEQTRWMNITQSSQVTIEANNLSITDTALIAIIGSGSANLNLAIKNISSDSLYNLISNNGCSLQLRTDELNFTNALNTSGILFASGDQASCIIEAIKIVAINFDTTVANTLFQLNSNATLVMNNSSVTTSSSTLINARNGILLAENLRVTMNNISGRCVAFYTGDHSTLKNIDIFHVSPSITDQCISGSSVEIVGTVNSNFPVQAGIPISIGEFNYDTNFFI